MASEAPTVFGPSKTNPKFERAFVEPIKQHRELCDRFERELGEFLARQKAQYHTEEVRRLQEEVAVLKNRSATVLIDGMQRALADARKEEE